MSILRLVREALRQIIPQEQVKVISGVDEVYDKTCANIFPFKVTVKIGQKY